MPPPPRIRMLVTPYIPQPDHDPDDDNDYGVYRASNDHDSDDDDAPDHSYDPEGPAAEKFFDPTPVTGLRRGEEYIDARDEASENAHNVQTTGMNNAEVARPVADPSPVVAQTTRSHKAPGAGSRLPFRPLPASFANHQNTTEEYFLSNFAGLSVDESDNGVTGMPPQHQYAPSRPVVGSITNGQKVKVSPHSGNANVDATMIQHETYHASGANPDSSNPPLGAFAFSPEAFMRNEESLNELRGSQQRLWELHEQNEREVGSAKEHERAEASIRSFSEQQNSIKLTQQPDISFTSALDSFEFHPENFLSKESLGEARRINDRLWKWNEEDGREDTVLKRKQRIAAESSIKKCVENEKKTEAQKAKARPARKIFAFGTPSRRPLFSTEHFLDKKSPTQLQGLQDWVGTWREQGKGEDARLKMNQRDAVESSIEKYITNEKENEKKTEARRGFKMFAFGAPSRRSLFSTERFLDNKSPTRLQGLQDLHEDERIKQEQRVDGEDSISEYVKNQKQAELAHKNQDQGSSNPLVKKEPDDEE